MPDSTEGGVQPPGQASPAAALREAVPGAMRELRQWLLWRREKYTGDTKPRKVPYYVSGRKRSGVQGGGDDRAELQTFEIALTHLVRGRYDGLGFAFLPGDGLVGIDIDGAIDEHGEVSERCQAIIEACGSYTELSPSGRGVHIICAGETPTFKDNRIGLEVFCGRQFFTVTGRRWAGTPEQVQPLGDGTLRRLQATVRGSKAAARRKGAAAPGAEAPAGADGPAHEAARHVQQYVTAALLNAQGIMRAAGEGGRNDMLNAQAFGLAQLVHTGAISEAVIRATLGEAARACGLEESEIQATLNSAVRAGLQDPRAVPERAPAAPRRRGRAARGDEGASTPSTGSAKGGEIPPGGPTGADGAGAPRGVGEDWRKLLICSADGGKKDCRENVFVLMSHHPALAGLVGYDQFGHRVMKLRKPPWDSELGEWTNNDDYLLGYWLARHERLTVKSEASLVAGVAMAAHAARYHPVVQHFDALPAWDQVERLPHWMHECLGAADSDYTRLVGTWFLMSLVRRVRQPGCQMDYMVVLEGLQGKRKSSALRLLAIKDEWFSDTPVRIGTPDAMLSIAGKVLVEMPEMDAFNRAEATAAKAYLTSRIDRVREPYSRRFEDRPRSGVFAGTTNQAEYFKDPTGARRFWPVACDGEIDLEKLAQWRDQLFAEAIYRLASDDAEVRRCWPTRAEEERYLVPEQERREIVDPWCERLAQWLDSAVNYGDGGVVVREVDSFTSFELLTKCLMVPQDRIDGGRQMATRVGIAMHKLGWDKRRDSGAGRVWRYWRPAPAEGSRPVAGAQGGAPGGPGAVVENEAVELHEF